MNSWLSMKNWINILRVSNFLSLSLFFFRFRFSHSLFMLCIKKTFSKQLTNIGFLSLFIKKKLKIERKNGLRTVILETSISKVNYSFFLKKYIGNWFKILKLSSFYLRNIDDLKTKTGLISFMILLQMNKQVLFKMVNFKLN